MINVIGQFFGTSGYSKHTRYLSNALNKLTDVCLNVPLPQGWERDVNDKELEMIKRKPDNEANLIITHPVHWRINCQAKHNIVYLIWEGDKVPKWIEEEIKNPNIEKVICPSEHTYNAVPENLREKLIIIPHGVDLDIFKPLPQEERIFTFLANKGFRNMEDRGGIQYLIKAYLEEFTNENVELMLKINPAYGLVDIPSMFPISGPTVKILADELTNEQLNKLYNQCDVFVSPTRAEAFNIPCLEALACGKPVITTNYGGQTDYCDNMTGWLIDYDLVNVEHELEYEGVKWATPKIEDLRKALREAFELKRDFKNPRGVAENYTWNNTATKIHELIV